MKLYLEIDGEQYGVVLEKPGKFTCEDLASAFLQLAKMASFDIYNYEIKNDNLE